MLELKDTVLIVIDVQGKLAQIMHNKDAFFDNLKRIINAVKILDIPVLWLEQIPESLGLTTPEIAKFLRGHKPVSKYTFSACGNQEFMKELKEINRKQILLAGIETHICVYQTAVDLLNLGYEVHILADAVASRVPANKDIGLERIKMQGGIISSVEMALFEIIKHAKIPEFKNIIEVIK